MLALSQIAHGPCPWNRNDRFQASKTKRKKEKKEKKKKKKTTEEKKCGSYTTLANEIEVLPLKPLKKYGSYTHMNERQRETDAHTHTHTHTYTAT